MTIKKEQPPTITPSQGPNVNANLQPSLPYWNGGTFVVPGYQSYAPTQVPASMLPSPNSRLMANLTPGQQADLQNLTQPQQTQGAQPAGPMAPPPAQGAAPGQPSIQSLLGGMGQPGNPLSGILSQFLGQLPAQQQIGAAGGKQMLNTQSPNTGVGGSGLLGSLFGGGGSTGGLAGLGSMFGGGLNGLMPF